MAELSSNPRESARHYIPASEADIQAMLEAVGKQDLRALYSHLPESALRQGDLPLPHELGYGETRERIAQIAQKNRVLPSFIGDGLQDFSVHPVVGKVSAIRNLSTAYTPYQPERSQGTLLTQWIFQCVLTSLTGFEAINSSLYDRSTGIFEAACSAIRLGKKADTVLVAANLYPGDIEVLKTHVAETAVRIEWLEPDAASGLLCAETLAARAAGIGERLAGVVFAQTNNLGLLEDVDALTDATHAAGALAIAVIDPLLLGTGGLKAPSAYGKSGQGADIIVGEAQHLAIGPNFGGPGLGIFGVRHNDKVKQHVRATPGRYVGKAADAQGRECCVMVLSTREQHIRKDKATSNICSNQAFLATLAGASVLARGEQGIAQMVAAARAGALAFLKQSRAKLAFAAPFFNEVTVEVRDAAAFLERARAAGVVGGVAVSDRIGGGRELVKLSFNDHQSEAAIATLAALFAGEPQAQTDPLAQAGASIPAALLRQGAVGLPQFGEGEVEDYYRRLGELNVSPDDGCYPLGSCTMKYNPALNDWAAGLAGFTDIHPQAPVADAQGSLEVLYEIQEWFKGITNLAAVTTQPVAGAQGELVGLKLFQAYHRHNGQAHRNVILIPRSAHGTNFATAAVAGLGSAVVDGVQQGIVLLEEDADGLINMDDFRSKIAEFGDRLCGVMITNPNTRGIFETHFGEIAAQVHAAGGLVYMDGANMNAIAGWVDLDKLGVDAVHNNLHKSWSIPHGGGGPGDGMVAVSARLADFLPGYQIEKLADGSFAPRKPALSIGSFHRHWGNFAHKVRAYTYLMRLGREGVRRMSAMSVLSARYVLSQLGGRYPTLPASGSVPRMHEFILTLTEADFQRLESVGVSRALAATRVGKLFLDFGFHAPTVAWPEPLGLMIEPTESYTKAELDRFAQAVLKIKDVIENAPECLASAPHFTPVDRVDEVAANRSLSLSETLRALPPLHTNRVSPAELNQSALPALYERVLAAAPSAASAPAPSL